MPLKGIKQTISLKTALWMCFLIGSGIVVCAIIHHGVIYQIRLTCMFFLECDSRTQCLCELDCNRLVERKTVAILPSVHWKQASIALRSHHPMVVDCLDSVIKNNSSYIKSLLIKTENHFMNVTFASMNEINDIATHFHLLY